MSAPYIHGASIPGSMREETGGGVFNALRVAAQFATACALISARGGDAAGVAVAAEAKRAGIDDQSSTFLDRNTASYTALLDSEGDVVAALADMSIYESALPRLITRRKTRDMIETADAVLADANMPEASIAKLAAQADGKPLFALAISPAKAVRLRAVLPRLDALFLNHREARAILALEESAPDSPEQLAMALWLKGLRRGVLTDGERPACILEDGQLTFVQPPIPERIADVTGAGDALCGAAIAALLHGRPLAEAVLDGLAAAAVTVETEKAVADFSGKHRFIALRATIRPEN
ncbi:MAG: PfkB family carbohydrate kinase [Rhizobiaceae bacterium]